MSFTGQNRLWREYNLVHQSLRAVLTTGFPYFFPHGYINLPMTFTFRLRSLTFLRYYYSGCFTSKTPLRLLPLESNHCHSDLLKGFVFLFSTFLFNRVLNQKNIGKLWPTYIGQTTLRKQTTKTQTGKITNDKQNKQQQIT